MPLFEYVCKRCGHQFEELVLGTTQPNCPSCHGRKLEKLMSTFAVNTNGGNAMTREAATACGTCGDPRGPGACAMNN